MSEPGKPLDLQELETFRLEPSNAGLLFDLDGTLSTIVDDPMAAHLTDAARARLARLAEAYGLVAVVSGRSAQALLDIVRLPEVTYVGNHGLEILLRGHRRVFVDEDHLLRLRIIARDLARKFRDEPGIFFEDKELSISIHYRRAESPQTAAAGIRQVLASVDLNGFTIRNGKKLFQVRPEVPVNKGSTVTVLLRERGLRMAIYAGDDLTDLDVFSALGALRAEGYQTLSIGVRDPETQPEVLEEADCTVEGVAGVQGVLRALAP